MGGFTTTTPTPLPDHLIPNRQIPAMHVSIQSVATNRCKQSWSGPDRWGISRPVFCFSAIGKNFKYTVFFLISKHWISHQCWVSTAGYMKNYFLILFIYFNKKIGLAQGRAGSGRKKLGSGTCLMLTNCGLFLLQQSTVNFFNCSFIYGMTIGHKWMRNYFETRNARSWFMESLFFINKIAWMTKNESWTFPLNSTFMICAQSQKGRVSL